jgi:hypothetical protein
MPKSWPAEFVDSLAAKYVAPELKARGFTRRGRRWLGPEGDVRQYIELISSRWNASDSGSFNLWAGSVIPAVFDVWTTAESVIWNKRPPAFPQLTNTMLSLYLLQDKSTGELSLDQRWRKTGAVRGIDWDFDQSTDQQLLGPEVTNSIVNVAIPFLDDMGTYRTVQSYVREVWRLLSLIPHQRLHLAILDAMLGDWDEFEMITADLLDGAWYTYSQTIRDIVLDRHGRNPVALTPSSA